MQAIPGTIKQRGSGPVANGFSALTEYERLKFDSGESRGIRLDPQLVASLTWLPMGFGDLAPQMSRNLQKNAAYLAQTAFN